MKLLGKIVIHSTRLLTGVIAYIFPSYCTVLRLVKAGEPNSENQQILKLQTICNYWFVILTFHVILILLNNALQPTIYLDGFKLALNYYLVKNDFANSELFFRGVICNILSSMVQITNWILPQNIQQFADFAKKAPKFQQAYLTPKRQMQKEVDKQISLIAVSSIQQNSQNEEDSNQ